MEFAPDRDRKYVAEGLDKALALCRTHGAELAFVDFGSRLGWRSHYHLRNRIGEADVRSHPLEPVPLDGFDPVLHFQQWRSTLETLKRAQLQGEALRQAILAVVQPYLSPESDPPGYQSAAALLNEKGPPTKTGRLWTRHNLRMFLNKTGMEGQDVAAVPTSASDTL